MTDIQNHISRWKNNRQFISTIDPAHCEWAVTAAFYSCLHGVQAYLVRKGFNPQKHSERNRDLKDCGWRATGSERQRVRELSDLYKALREASNHTRYEPTLTKYTTPQAIQEEIIDKVMARTEELLRGLLGPSAVGTLDAIQLQQAELGD